MDRISMNSDYISKLIKDQRETQDISQYELARKSGVSRQTINSIECRKSMPSIEVLEKILKILGYEVLIKRIEHYDY